jgi:hypothetical protein
MPPLNPDVADLAPSGHILTDYDEEHAVTYIRMLDADKEGADWREVSRIVLHIDPIAITIERGKPSTHILRGRNGWRDLGTANCCVVADVRRWFAA